MRFLVVKADDVVIQGLLQVNVVQAIETERLENGKGGGTVLFFFCVAKWKRVRDGAT